MILRSFGTAGQAAEALAAEVAAALRAGLAGRGAASLAVPGGRTPLPFFHALRPQALDWSRVSVTLTDERWVPESDSASNGALVRSHLLQGGAAAARFLPLYDGSLTAAGAAASVHRSLRALPGPFDAVVLGMGEDGHFASLFPASPGIEEALDPGAPPACVAMRAPAAPAERISLNLAALADTRRLFLLITGAAKQELLHRAGQGEGDGYPIAALIKLRQPALEVYWSP